jgi:hypothetical protein
VSARVTFAIMTLAAAVIILSAPAARTAAPAAVAVKYPEGTVHGFLELRSESGALLAHGDLTQVVRDGGIDSRMIFHFADTSTVFDETVRFTQDGTFAMQDYHLVQRGDIFPFALDATISRDGHYTVRTTSKAKDAVEQRFTGKLDLPSDVANGLPITLAKNIGTHDPRTVHIVAFTPEPRVIGLEIAPAAASSVMIGGHAESATEYVLRPKLGAALHFFASLAGKAPPDSHAWIITDDVPAFVRFEGPMYYGPVFHLSLASPSAPESKSSPPKERH